MKPKKVFKNDQCFYRIDICLRSRKNPTIKLQRRTMLHPTEAQALRAGKELLRKTQEEVFSLEREGVRWGSLRARWELALRAGTGSEKPIQPTTAQDYVAALRLYTGHWDTRPADSITKPDIRAVVSNLQADGKSLSRQKTLKNAINGMFAWAIESNITRGVTQSPAYGVKLSKEQESERPEILTLPEIRKLLEAAKDQQHPWLPVWAFALLTGMRSGELFALTWPDVDMENKKITVSKSYNGRMKEIKSTKAGYWREVPINQNLFTMLQELKAQSKDPYVLPRLYGWERGEAARILRAFCVGIGITSVRFHTLRSCFATHLLRDNLAPVKLMKICGWRDMKTMQRYVRLAGIETLGATDSLKLLPDKDVMACVVPLFVGNSETACLMAAQQDDQVPENT